MVLWGQPVAAKDYFLTIGGGYSPTGNQISLEKNVLMFQEMLGEEYPDGVGHDIYFADGNNTQRDLQFHDPNDGVPKVNRELARIFKQTRYLGYQYRDHQIPHVAGTSSRGSLDKWFKEKGTKLQKGDRLVIYATAHGGRSSDKKAPGNTKLYMWNGENIQVKEMIAHFDKLPEGVSVALVMVQCYSGGYANAIFNEADPKKDVSKQDRCGFFATVQTRQAAGCTPDIDEANYQEYSSYFWIALRGKNRAGQEIEKPDYDKNGTTSLDEAHAYAVLESPTIDIPIKTSGAMLRSVSKMKDKDAPNLLSIDTRFDELFKLASPSERAILEGLSKQLGLSKPERGKEAKALAAKIDGDKKKVEAEKKKVQGAYNASSDKIGKLLKIRWPELANRWDPRVSDLLSKDSAEVLKAIESHGEYKKISKMRSDMEKFDTQRLNHEKKWCKCQRLLRTLENVALAANLPKVASEDKQQRYAQMIAAERGGFGPLSAAAAEELAARSTDVVEPGNVVEQPTARPRQRIFGRRSGGR